MNREALERFSAPIIKLFLQLESEILFEMGKRLGEKQELLEEDVEVWKLRQMEILGILDEHNLEIIRKYANLTNEELNKLLIEATLESLNYSEEILKEAVKQGADILEPIPIDRSPRIFDVLAAYESQARDVFNLTNQSLLENAQTMYIESLNKLTMDISSGFKSRSQAIREVIREWADKGIPALINKRGHKLGVEGYVRMVTVSTLNNLTNEVQDIRLDEWGIDLVEISSHAGNRPGCRPYAGRVFSLKPGHPKYKYLYDPSVGRIGDADSLFGINCGHVKYPYIEGVTERTYKPPESAKEDQRIYEESQKQRQLERNILKAKREYVLMEKVGDTEGQKAARIKILKAQQAMREFIDETGRTRRRDREQLAVDNPHVSGKIPEKD